MQSYGFIADQNLPMIAKFVRCKAIQRFTKMIRDWG